MVESSDTTTSKNKGTSGKTGVQEKDKFRGYKTLSDGRKTTYFNMERTEEEKALIGDITPKRIDR